MAVSEPALEAASGPILTAPEDEIFDRTAVEDALVSRLQELGDDNRAIRAATVEVLKEALATGRDRIAAAFEAAPHNARPVVASYAYLTDCVIGTAFDIAITRLHPRPNPTASERLSIMAVGGYGRAEMAPHSDVDLLFLTPYKITAWAESVIESMLYILWDLRLKVGHSSRTIRDCIRLAKEDYTIRTALLEHRYLGGDPVLAEELGARLWSDLFANTASEFIEAKLAERSERHRKQGERRFMVEPNVKEGKGGLRDLQSLFWIAKYLHGVREARDLVALGMLSAEEFEGFEHAENFLYAVRCHLHLIANRASDQLTFDMQVLVAERMGYTDRGGRRAVEHFMQDYFRHATQVGDLTRIFLTGLEARHVRQAPLLSGFFKRRRKVRDGYKVVHNRLTVADPETFSDDPLNILRIFEEAVRTGLLIHADAMLLVSANLDLINDELRNSKEAVRIFIDLIVKHGNPERALRRMNELGVLGRFIPEFGEIVAMMQFNMYHHYTVDEHTIQCLSILAQIERGELVEELPVASRILANGVNRKVLYVALLCHDMGKGRDEDHSVLGARISRRVTAQLRLKPEEAETVEWLVRYHLLMSDMAQKRDISDPRTIRGFAKAVKTRKRLDLLTVLTVCDIRGVGPDVWNNWKAQLIRALYRGTVSALEDGLEAVNTTHREDEAKRALREACADWDKRDLRRETGRHYGPYWQGLQTDEHIIFAKLLKDLPDDEVGIDVHPDDDRDATRACFAMIDHPGIFARLAGAVNLSGANVVDARSYTTKDGYATAVFWLQDKNGAPYDKSGLDRLRRMIYRILKGEVVTSVAFEGREKIRKRERDFRVPTMITFDNEGSEIYTIIEVDTRDRPGLLYDLARTLANANVYVSSAVIATYGEQVVDTFYVKDMFGLKLHSAARQQSLEKKLRAAIETVAERAGA